MPGYLIGRRNLSLFDSCMEHPLYFLDLSIISATYKSDRSAPLSGTSGSSDPVNIIIKIIRYIIIEHIINATHINSTCRDICCKKHLYRSTSESVHYIITLILRKVSVKGINIISFCLELFIEIISHMLCITENKSFLRIIIIH